MKIGRNDPCPCGSGKKFKNCCIDKPEYKSSATVVPFPTPHRDTSNPLTRCVLEGNTLAESGEDEAAANVWLEGWDNLVESIKEGGFESADELSRFATGQPSEFVSNWIQDLEDCMGNLSMHDAKWAEKRLRCAKEVCTLLPRSNREILFGMQRAEAECLFLLGRLEDGDACFAKLVEDYPKDAWAYIGWGDMHSPVFYGDRWPSDKDKARQIYERGLAVCGHDCRDLQQRIGLLDGLS